MHSSSFGVNDRTYTMPGAPVVVICIDGSEPEYHAAALSAGRMPSLSRMLDVNGSSWPGHCAMPALTNPNNMSIATGQPPSVHGISGNYTLDTETGTEMLMNDSRFLRAPTIFAAATAAGLDVVVVTAKDKLRRLLGAGLVDKGPPLDGGEGLVEPQRTGVCFSAEKADEVTLAANGIEGVLELVGKPLPAVYSAELSEFALAAGAAIYETRCPDLMYVTLTDYVQHKHAPGTEEANSFYAMIDSYIKRFDDLGAVVVVTADHGMSAKTDADGRPNILYVEDEVRRIIGVDGARVILPITDPYTAHHGALGSFASVYLPAGVDHALVIDRLRMLPGVSHAHSRREAAELYRLPADRIGDIVLLAEAGTALGRYAEWHDLSGLDAPLRSHGALGEVQVPFIVNRRLPRPAPLDEPYGEPAYVHNYDAFWVATTLASQQSQTVSTL